MKTINIFGRKMPIVAILMALLVVGTASAAVFDHYATLNGTVDVTAPVFVTGVDIGGSGDLVFGSPASFEISNDGDIPVIVVLETTVLYAGYGPLDDLDGVYVDYDVIENGDDIEEGEVLVPPGGLTVHVDLETDEFIYPGTYNVQVEVMTYEGGEPYYEFGGNNAIETIDLSFKNSDWELIENGYITVDYMPMGNNFAYRLTSDGVDLTDYALIYYADYPDRFEMYGGDNPGFVINDDIDISDGEVILGSVNVGMDMPHIDDANYDTTYTDYTQHPDFYDNSCGAKLWLIPSSHLTDDTSLPMDTWDWSLEFYMFETELIHYTDTNIVV